MDDRTGDGILVMQRLLLAGTLGLAIARKAAAILDADRVRDQLAEAADQDQDQDQDQNQGLVGPGVGPALGQSGFTEQARDGVVLRAIMDSANECLGHFDGRPPGERWCDTLLRLLDLAAFAEALG